MIALDTNILIHAHRRDASLHAAACKALRQMAESGRPWGICYHSLVEFYGVVTQPRLWVEASTPEQAVEQITAWRESPTLSLLTDTEATLATLKTLLVQARVQGSVAHDARIAACCIENGVSELWTVDRDFSRFPRLTTRNPLL